MKPLEFGKKRLRGRMSVREGLAMLGKDPGYVAAAERRARGINRAINDYNMAAGPLKAELAQAGFPVDKVSDLFYMRYDYRPAFPILMKWLPRLENLDVKEEIVRALTDKWARPVAARPLIEEFRGAPVGNEFRLLSYKWAIGNALAMVADDSVFDEIVELIRDQRHGWSRDMLCKALGRMKNPQVDDILIDLLIQDSGQMGIEASPTPSAIRALGNRKSSKAKSYIEKFLVHPAPLVCKEAEKSIDKIRKAEQKARERAEE